MIFNTQHIALVAMVSTFANALPLDLLPRAKSYSVINVDGGVSTAAPTDATTIVEQTTKTVEITSPGPTVTAKITATVVEPVSAPVATSASTSSSTSSSASTPTPTLTMAVPPSVSPVYSTSIETPRPVFVTVTITTDDGPTEYYDSGMWHTSYRIKSFEAVATTTVLSSVSTITSTATGLPAW